MKQDIINKIEELRDRGAVFYVSHSGGKDSQTMYLEIKKIVPQDQIVVVHAHLPEVVWAGEQDHIRNTIDPGTQFEVVQAGKTFMEMVDRRQMWPSPKYRQCTSDLKRDPVNKFMRADLKAKGKFLAVSCIGIRAEESPNRSRAKEFKINNRMSKAGREVYDLLPIHDYLLQDVWDTIAAAGQEPHWAYGEGMTRLSCCFCIMASSGDLRTAARLNPDLYKRLVEKEKEIGHTIRHGMTLEQITGMDVDEIDRPCY